MIYFFLAARGRIYMAAVYAKSKQETLSAADQNALAKLAALIKKAEREHDSNEAARYEANPFGIGAGTKRKENSGARKGRD